MIRPVRRSLALGLVALSLLCMQPASAAPTQDEQPDPTLDETTPGWAVEPGGAGDRSWFVYQLAPGQTLRDTIAIENPLDKPITLDLYGADAFNTEDAAAFALEEPGSEPDDVGAWLTIGQTQYTIEPGRRVEIPFEIAVPADASPGDHAGGVVGANIEEEDVVDATGATLSLNRRIGARVYVRVEGPLDPALDIKQLSLDVDVPSAPIPGGAVAIQFEVRNVGNVRLTPSAILRLKGLFGRTITSFPAQQLPELLPGGSVTVSLEHSGGIWPLDRVRPHLTVSANDVTVERASTSWAISPSLLILVALALLVVAIRRIRSRRRGDAEVEVEDPPRAKELVGS